MNWLPVMTLPDGTTIEVPFPTPEQDYVQDPHSYRVSGPDGSILFATLQEAADHVLQLPDRAWRKS